MSTSIPLSLVTQTASPPGALAAAETCGGVSAHAARKRPPRPAPSGPGAALDAFVKAVAPDLYAAGGSFVASQARAALGPTGLGAGAPAVATSTTTSTTSTRKTTASGAALPRELAFLNDPKLSIQDKVFRLLLWIQQKYDRDVEAKMKELGGASKSSASSSSGGTRPAAKPKKKGLLSKVTRFAEAAFPMVGLSMEMLRSPQGRKALEQISGPLLGAAAVALGAPQLAPVAAKLGPSLVAGLADAQDALLGEAPVKRRASSGGSGSSGGSSTSATTGSKDEKTLAMELEYLLERQKFATSLLSNCMRSMHETSMSVVNNIR
ncbi:MAG: hypothetical protein QM704_16310 [Anaeromyxobacteraceae bacterium]